MVERENRFLTLGENLQRKVRSHGVAADQYGEFDRPGGCEFFAEACLELDFSGSLLWLHLVCHDSRIMKRSVPDTMKTKSKGFVQYGIDASVSVDYRYEDYLVGDREGFKYLHMKIEEVLDGADEVIFDSDEVYVDLVGIRVAGRTIKDQVEDKASGWLAGVGCILGLVLILCVLVLGVWKLLELLAS